MKLESIGFYTLFDERARNTAMNSDLYRLEILLTNRCNFKCPYCRGNGATTDANLEDVMSMIDLCAERNLHNIRFSGGEPTLYHDLNSLVHYAKVKGVERIAISTNGSASLDYYKKLIESGVNDFSISLDACCVSYGEIMSGGVSGAWERVVENIRELSKLTYLSVGVVLTEDTMDTANDVIHFADSLGVSDIRVISSAQHDGYLNKLKEIDWNLLKKYPILRSRTMFAVNGRHIRGLQEEDSHRCPLVLDDIAICNGEHYPCIIYLREGGRSLGKFKEGYEHVRHHFAHYCDTHADPICKKNCLDFCVTYNNKVREIKKR